METKTPKIKVATIAARHVKQLALEHYWPWVSRFDFNTVHVLGRMAASGDILCEDKENGGLRLISCVAYIDWQCAQAGAVLPNGEYAPAPHTAYFEKARELWGKLPQLFTESLSEATA